MGYHVVVKRRAEKELDRLDAKIRTLLLKYLFDTLEGCENPKGIPGAKPLEGVKNGWRWRVGVYRILGTIEEKTITIEIFRIGHRRDVYRNLP
ncbi:MAG: type II toxin-antitoxin system RelE/ParE family toxin [Raoultibacter sp.]